MTTISSPTSKKALTSLALARCAWLANHKTKSVRLQATYRRIRQKALRITISMKNMLTAAKKLMTTIACLNMPRQKSTVMEKRAHTVSMRVNAQAALVIQLCRLTGKKKLRKHQSSMALWLRIRSHTWKGKLVPMAHQQKVLTEATKTLPRSLNLQASYFVKAKSKRKRL